MSIAEDLLPLPVIADFVELPGTDYGRLGVVPGFVRCTILIREITKLATLIRGEMIDDVRGEGHAGSSGG